MGGALSKTFDWVRHGGLAIAVLIAGPAMATEPYASCRRVELVDAQTGWVITGAEDLDYDPARGRLFVSAYDRRAAEQAASTQQEKIPEGGLYAISLSALRAADDAPLEVQPLLRRADRPAGLRPHGISYDPETGILHFINREYRRVGARWKMRPVHDRIGGDGTRFLSGHTFLPCHANDLAVRKELRHVSTDHGHCGWRAGLEDVFNLKSTALQGVSWRVRHANGVVAVDDERFALAATRDRAVFLFDVTGRKHKQKIKLPGGPDNLTRTEDGALIAAIHPNLLRLGLQRKLGIGRAGSRIVRIDPDRGTVVTLFDDPKATLFSAATAAVEAEGLLIAGSVVDRGLLVCRHTE